MNNLPKNKNVLIAGVIIFLLVIAAGYFLFFGKSSQNANQATNAAPTEVPVLSLKPDEIGLTLVENAAGNRATMKITKTDDISSIDYQFTYNADVDGQSILRGTTGHADVKTPGQTISQEMIFGTCSDVCHYDKGVKDVKLIVKVTKTDGKIYQTEVTPSE